MSALRVATGLAVVVLVPAVLLAGVAVPAALAADVRVSITDRLDPADVTVTVGTAVTWTNDDDERHRIRSRDGAAGFDSGNLEPGESFTFVFEVAGDHPYRDERDPDPAYHGSVTVTPGDGEVDGGGAPAASGGSSTGGAVPAGPGDADGSGDANGGGQVDVAILDRSFSPATIDITAGAKVTWTNGSDREHTVTFTEGGGSGELGNGGTFTRTFDAPGTFEYVCAFHPEMTGVVEVTAASADGVPDDRTADTGGSDTGAADPPQPDAGSTATSVAAPSRSPTGEPSVAQPDTGVGASAARARPANALWLVASFVAGAGAAAAGIRLRR